MKMKPRDREIKIPSLGLFKAADMPETRML